MPDDLLTSMATTGYGPVTLVDAGGGEYAAATGTSQVAVAVDREALRFSTSVDVVWPAGDRGSIVVALEELAHTHRPELVTIDDGPGNRLEVTVWIPADGATQAAVAGAVYSTARIATLAGATVADHAALMQLGDLEPVQYVPEPDDDRPPPPPPPPPVEDKYQENP